MQWMPLVEFVEQPLIQEDSMFKKIVDIFIARLGKRYCGLSTHQVVSKFDGMVSSLYYNVIDNEDNCVGKWELKRPHKTLLGSMYNNPRFSNFSIKLKTALTTILQITIYPYYVYKYPHASSSSHSTFTNDSCRKNINMQYINSKAVKFEAL